MSDKPHLSISAPKRRSNWKGGRLMTATGYWQVWSPGHPRARKGYVYEHILIAEKAVGRFLPVTVDIHHFNEVRSDNTNSNLVVCPNHAYHRLLHARKRIVDRGGDPNREKICQGCKDLKPRSEFTRNRSRYDGLETQCQPCMSERKIRAYRSQDPVVLRARLREARQHKFAAMHVRRPGDVLCPCGRYLRPGPGIQNHGRRCPAYQGARS